MPRELSVTQTNVLEYEGKEASINVELRRFTVDDDVDNNVDDDVAIGRIIEEEAISYHGKSKIA